MGLLQSAPLSRNQFKVLEFLNEISQRILPKHMTPYLKKERMSVIGISDTLSDLQRGDMVSGHLEHVDGAVITEKGRKVFEAMKTLVDLRIIIYPPV
jgi:hypothetical protein